MVRTVQSSTIISYHTKLHRTAAERLHAHIDRTDRSVYWSKLFERSKDPTFLFLCFLWYVMYEWDEVFEVLYGYINQLVSTATALVTGIVRCIRYLHRNNWFSAPTISGRRGSCTFCMHIYFTIRTFSKISGNPFFLSRRPRILQCRILLWLIRSELNRKVI